MIKHLSDFRTEAADKYADHIRRAEQQRQKGRTAGVRLWLVRAQYWAWDNVEEYRVRQMLEQLEHNKE